MEFIRLETESEQPFCQNMLFSRFEKPSTTAVANISLKYLKLQSFWLDWKSAQGVRVISIDFTESGNCARR
jgi:hypothetical protein